MMDHERAVADFMNVSQDVVQSQTGATNLDISDYSITAHMPRVDKVKHGLDEINRGSHDG